MTFSWTMIRENYVQLNADSEKCLSALWSFANSTIRSIDFRQFFVSSKQRFGQIVFRQNDDSTKRRFRKMIWPREISIKVKKNIVTSPQRGHSIWPPIKSAGSPNYWKIIGRKFSGRMLILWRRIVKWPTATCTNFHICEY